LGTFAIDPSDTAQYDHLPPEIWGEIATTSMSVDQTGGSVTIITNKPVKVQLVSLQTGAIIDVGGEIMVLNERTIHIANLKPGCVYAVLIKQGINNVNYLIRAHNFCR